MTVAAWIDLEGAENVRDLGGMPTVDGAAVRPGALIRSDSLQELSPADVRHLVDDLRVRTVVDLRTGVEVDAEGPGPMMREPLVDVRHLSLFPETGRATESAAGTDGPVVLPWQERDAREARRAGADDERRGVSGVYLRYLDERPDSVLEALRLIATSDGATIVHCAAGKDRTGVVVAFALTEVGVEPQAIVDDYARSAERIREIVTRLSARRTYAGDLDAGDLAKHAPRAVSMQRMLTAMDEVHGGIRAWLRRNGWTDDDAARLRDKLLG